MTESILLTGGTGFLGTELAARLIRIPGVKIYACIRSENQAEAYCRAKYAWFHEKELYRAIGGAVIPVSGDFTKPELGLDAETREILRETVTLVLHVGAEIGFQKSAETLFKVNVAGTERMLSFAAGMNSPAVRILCVRRRKAYLNRRGFDGKADAILFIITTFPPTESAK